MMIADIEIYFEQQLKNIAERDENLYLGLVGTEFEAPEIRAQYFYIHNKPKGYKVDFPSPQYFRIMMRVNPCANKVSALCCQ
jgi:hypothetical protein